MGNQSRIPLRNIMSAISQLQQMETNQHPQITEFDTLESQ